MSAALSSFERSEQALLGLRTALSVLAWDEQVNMPPAGASARGTATAALAELYHAALCDPALGSAIDELSAANGHSDLVRARVREAQRERERAVRVPAELVRELAETESRAFESWQRARAEHDFSIFAPDLAKMVELKRTEADAVGYGSGERYDALLDSFEPGATVAFVEPLLTALREELVPFAHEVLAKPRPDDSFLTGSFPIDLQKEVSRTLASSIGFDLTGGRIDVAAHPFASGFAARDVRLTTHYFADNLQSIWSTLHEAGHGTYEQGLEGEITGTFCERVTSLTLHESQSRLWENMVGRSRPFWQRTLPLLKQQFPGELHDVTVSQIVRAINIVEPSLIRIYADEVTYHLHVLLRFELELALMRGQLEVADLPAAWNEKMTSLVGVTPPHDGDGVLQDVHWSAGLFGYFPTYTMGTMLSAQLWEAAGRDLGDLDAMVLAGNTTPLLEWMRTHVHQRGSLVSPAQVIRDATGEDLQHRALMRYLRGKFGELYEL